MVGFIADEVEVAEAGSNLQLHRTSTGLDRQGHENADDWPDPQAFAQADNVQTQRLRTSSSTLELTLGNFGAGRQIARKPTTGNSESRIPCVS